MVYGHGCRVLGTSSAARGEGVVCVHLEGSGFSGDIISQNVLIN